jgi:predicted acylesterase/phospholipase RssA
VLVKALRTRLLPPIFPRFSEEIYRAAMVMTAEITRIRLEEAHPELVLYPKIPDDLSIFLGFPRAAEAIAAGEQAARQAIVTIKDLIKP